MKIKWLITLSSFALTTCLLPQYRQVIVYGNVKGGRLAVVNWQDYNSVKQALSLKD